MLSGAVGMLAAAPVLRAVAPGIAPHGPAALTASVVVAAGAALLPDLDHPSSTVAQSLGKPTEWLAKAVAFISGGHRKATHSVPGILTFTALFGLLGSRGDWFAWVPVTVLAGLAVAAVGLSGKVAAWARTAVLVAAGAWAGVDFGAWLGLAVGIGAAAHVAGDCATVQGCPLWWPRPRRYRYLELRTNGAAENWVAAFLVAGLVAGVFLSGVGSVLIDQTGAIR